MVKEKDRISLKEFMVLMNTSIHVANKNNLPHGYVKSKIKGNTSIKNALYKPNDIVKTTTGGTVTIKDYNGYLDNGDNLLPTPIYSIMEFEDYKLFESDILID